MFKISTPLGTFYLTLDLWGASLQLSFKHFSITWAHKVLKQHSKLTYCSWGRRSGTFTVCSAQSTAVGDSISLQYAPFYRKSITSMVAPQGLCATEKLSGQLGQQCTVFSQTAKFCLQYEGISQSFQRPWGICIVPLELSTHLCLNMERFNE